MPFSTTSPIPPQITLGDWVNVRAHLLWIYDAEVHPENLKMHCYLPDQTAFLIRKGSLLIETEKGSVTARAGQWIFPREGFRLQHFTVGARILSMHFYLAWAGGHRLFEWDVAEIYDAAFTPALEEKGRQLHTLVQDYFQNARVDLMKLAAPLAVHFLFQENFLQWLRVYLAVLEQRGFHPMQFDAMDARVLRTQQFLERLPLDADFREQKLAQRVGLSVSQLDRLFIKQFHCTPRGYQERRKLEYAISRIRHSSDVIKAIASDLGFHSLSHFSAWFRRHTQCSPRQMREHSLRGQVM